MDTLIVTQVLVAVGTVGLAAAALVSIRSSETTLRQMSEQLRYQRSQLIPYVHVIDWSIQGDKVHVTMKNLTKAPALGLGLRADFFVVEMAAYATPDSHSRRLTEQEAHEMSLRQDQLFGKYVLSDPRTRQKLQHKGLEVQHVGVVTFALSGLEGALLMPEQQATVEFAPRFGARKPGSPILYTFDFADLRALLISNNVRDLAVSLSLTYKDVSEEPVGSDTIVKFGASLNEAVSLEKAHAANHSIDFIALSRGEMLGPGRFVDDDMYHSMRPHWSLDDSNR